MDKLYKYGKIECPFCKKISCYKTKSAIPKNFTMMEKHVAEVFKSQSLFVDEHNEIHEKRVKMEMEKLTTSY